MKITLIGHASIFIETEDCRILMDPVLWDPHQEGLFDVHPPREVAHERVPPFDLLVISHRHLDHLDVRSLSHLPRDVTVVIPRDPLVQQAVSALGFSDVVTLAPLTSFSAGSTRLLTTASRAPLEEFGLVVNDPTGTCWNVVDTNLDAPTIDAVRSAVPWIDVLFAAWQPMHEVSFQWNTPIDFPSRPYAELLAHIARIAPRAVVPGSNGFRYRGASAWLNRVVFPVSRERFCADVERSFQSGTVAAHPMDPGDVIEISSGSTRVLRGHSPFVASLAPAGGELRFVPVDFDGRLVDPNPDALPAAELRRAVEQELGVDLPRFLESADPTLWRPHRERRELQQIDVVFPEERLSWLVDFTPGRPRVARGTSPHATMCSLITASALRGLISRTRTWDYAIMGGFYRRFSLMPSDEPTADPLRVRFPSSELREAVLALELARWSSARPLSSGRGACPLRFHPSPPPRAASKGDS
ncbi:MBL fold metallo-hydrolase [Sorangium sp. So ce204]|uniref:MBL fold metallo-hydrolase n=1 Tax=Sorangium sp. So ce204 TaxID=3133288 RepID=UPI003F61E937